MYNKELSLNKARRIYSFLLSLYPASYHSEFGNLMLQAFEDQCDDLQKQNEHIGIKFWIHIVTDEIKNIFTQQVNSFKLSEKWFNKYTIGLILGLILSTIAVLTNVIFPNPHATDDGPLIPLTYLAIFAIFSISAGYMSRHASNKLQSSIIAGAISSTIAFGLTMITFIIIDNVFLNIVSHQVDKMYGFAHQTKYHTMRDYVNEGNVRGLFFGTIMATVYGAFAGLFGAGLRKVIFLKK